MDNIKVSGIIHEKTSKKSGSQYVVLDVYLTPTYVKSIFLEQSDLEVVKLYLENENLKKENDK